MSKDKLELFIGPCVLESEELALTIADKVKSDLQKFEDKGAVPPEHKGQLLSVRDKLLNRKADL